MREQTHQTAEFPIADLALHSDLQTPALAGEPNVQICRARGAIPCGAGASEAHGSPGVGGTDWSH